MRLLAAADDDGDEQLADEFRERLEFVLVIEPAEQRDGNRAGREHGKLQRAAVNAVDNQAGGRKFHEAELEQDCAGTERQQNSRQHGKAAASGTGAS